MESNIKFKTTQNPFGNKNKHLTIRYPVYRPSEHQVNRFFMLFYTMIGGFASIVQTQITDAYHLVREDKNLFRFERKKRITEAKKCADELIAAFRHYMEEVDMYQWWLDTTDILEEDMKPDMMKCYFFLDNQFLRHGIGQHKLYTNLLMAEILSKMLQDSIDRFAEVMREQNGINTFNLAEQFTSPIRGVHERMRNAMEIIYPVEVDNKVFKGVASQFCLGFDIIGMKALDCKRAYNAIAKAAKLNAINIRLNDNGEEEEVENEELVTSDIGTPWTEMQVRALKIRYSDTPNKEIAMLVGRSVYDVVKQAKKLGLKKSKEYLRETRMANLKRS